MVEIKRIKKGNKEYFYIVHSYREGKAVKKKQFYLGESIPKDIDEKKKVFIQEFYLVFQKKILTTLRKELKKKDMIFLRDYK